MVEAGGGSNHVQALTEREIGKRRWDYENVLRRLTPDQKDAVFDLSNNLMEPDIYAQFRENPVNVVALNTNLREIGLSNKQRRRILRYFNLPYMQI